MTGLGAGKPGKESIANLEEVMMIKETWMQPYLAYMMNTTQRYHQNEKDNMMIQSLCHTIGEVIQKKYNRRVAAMRHPSRRVRHIKRHPRRDLRASC
jgi:hypothetical protein